MNHRAFSKGADDLAHRRQLAYERIAEDAHLTGDLTDAPAHMLLSWAEAQVRRLVAATKTLDEETAWQQLDPQLRDLRRQMRAAAKVAADTDNPTASLRQQLLPPRPTEKEDDKT